MPKCLNKQIKHWKKLKLVKFYDHTRVGVEIVVSDFTLYQCDAKKT